MSKRGKRFLSVLILAVIVSGVLMPSALANENTDREGSEVQRLVDAMQPGWNLGNTLDATGDETSWGNPKVTKELIEAIRAQGYNSIRIPITWDHRMGPGPDYTIDPAFMARVQEIVDWSLDAGLIAIINMHHDSRWMLNMANEREDVLARFRTAWTQIADHFKAYDPEKLLFEGINEPRFSEDWNEDRPIFFEMVHELQTTFYEVVRESGGHNGTRPLVLTTVTGGHGQARLDALVETIEQLADPRLIATVHFYGYYPFSVNMAGATTFDETARQDIIHNFNRIHDTFVKRGIPVIIGEFGLLGFDKYVETIQHGEVLKYLEFVTHYAREKRMTHMLWDNGQHFNRNELVWNNPDFHKVMMASLTGRSSYTESDTIYVHRGEALRDVTHRLHLNGNELTGIRAGDRLLEPGTDYERDGDRLTFKAGLLESLLGDGLGPQASLTLTFSAGADWVVHLVQYETPELKEAEWGRHNFAVPVKFNGDRLATMAAVYADGSFPAPEAWTPYKEFGKSFDPDYQYNVIRLLPDFLNEVKDGEVKLTFHFWSGTKLDYLLTVDGNSVIGKVPGQGDGGTQTDHESGADAAESGGTDSEGAKSDETAGSPSSEHDAAADSGQDKQNNRALLWGVIVTAALAALAGALVHRFIKS